MNVEKYSLHITNRSFSCPRLANDRAGGGEPERWFLFFVNFAITGEFLILKISNLMDYENWYHFGN